MTHLLSEDKEVLYAIPFCKDCEQPYEFDPEGPWAWCGCFGTIEWGYPRPAKFIGEKYEIVSNGG
jgi:hypothetical protein